MEKREMKTPKTNIFDVAKYILHTIGGEISTMKLQKLCYYCQAWHLVWTGVPLFSENFERLDNGPVCSELFNVHRGWFGIWEDFIREKYLSWKQLSLKEMAMINRVMDDYGMFDGGQLSELSHREDPWKLTPKNEVIPNDAILKYYSSLDHDEAPEESPQPSP
jgi:uncharacterized phage-associated protein